MTPSDGAARPRRSAFAAAFLTFLYPGLGHAYIGRWLRALLWALPPTLGIIALALYVSGQESLTEFAAGVAVDPTPLITIVIVDFLYRLVAVIDAWRLATDRTVGSASTRMLSAAGVVALLVVLVASHVVVAGAGLFGNRAITLESGDDSELLDDAELAEFRELAGLSWDDPEDGAVQAPGTIIAPPSEDEGALETQDPAEFEEWDGRKRLNILLVGIDNGRIGPASFLTDTMIVVSIDPPTGRVAFISLPRDTVNVPLPSRWGAGARYGGKINTLYTIARSQPGKFPGNDRERGFNALMGALGQLYGLDIKYYVSVDMSTFRNVVNTLGGVLVDVQLPVYDIGYSAGDGRGKLKLYMPPGITRMNGQRALAYARSRHGSNDFDRAARQQRVITSVRDQTDLSEIMQPGVLDELMKAVRRDVKSNIPPKLVPSLLSLAQEIDLDRRVNLVLSEAGGYTTTCYPCPPSGLFMLKPNIPRIRSAVQGVFAGNRQAARTISRIRDEAATVHVLNGYGNRNSKALDVARRLSGVGMEAQVPPVNEGRADSSDYRATVITVYNGADEAMPESFKRLKRTFKEKGVEVIRTDDPEQTADFVVTIGSRTKL
jgi:LCP family protein required for cell wall assembly